MELYQDTAEGRWGAPASDRVDWQIAGSWLEEHIGAGRILDVGCFDGRFLELLGSDWDRYGVEINRIAADQARRRNVSIVGNDVAELRNMRGRYDAITAFDVIEHVDDPMEMLRMLSSSVRDGGAIIVATGNTQAWSWQLMKNQYWYCTIPEHLSFVGEEWATRAAGKLGLEIDLVKRYSHDTNRTRLGFLRQGAASLILKFAPKIFMSLRRWGYGGIDVTGQEELLAYPPVWIAAKDQFLVVFRRSIRSTQLS